MIPHFTGPLSMLRWYMSWVRAARPLCNGMGGGSIERPAYFNEDLVLFKNGKLYLNPAPGLGVQFDPKKANFIMEITSKTKFPHPILQSPDGAIHNW